jgi:chromosome segregation ATPase
MAYFKDLKLDELEKQRDALRLTWLSLEPYYKSLDKKRQAITEEIKFIDAKIEELKSGQMSFDDNLDF